MSFTDAALKMVTKKDPKDGAPSIPSRSEREAKIKDRAGWVITVVAALLAVNTFLANGVSSTVLNNTIKANDVWNFYQAKSIKQSAYELAADNVSDPVKKQEYSKVVERYESDPTTGEGKKELMAAAKQLEADRDEAKKHGPWFSFAGSTLQLSIVLLSASILAVSMGMFWASVGVGLLGAGLLSQGAWMWMPFMPF
jgi:hypothetical protein